MKKITQFQKEVYQLCKAIPKGKVTTYKAIAEALGTKAYRAVGSALNKNPYAAVPCHRVIAADGSLGGFAHGKARKKQMLEKEGVIMNDDTIDLSISFHQP